jgi:4,5-dihydroxyphthalate decarboxylase
MPASSSPASEGGKAANRPDARRPQILGHDGTASVHLTLAVCDYDHTRDLALGAVRADGITLTPLVFDTIEEITFRFLKNLEWDISELSFGKYTSLASQGAAPMVAIPVFPSRVHRHSAIYVRAGGGIKSPKDLNGRTIGVPEWAQTAGVYVRGFLAEHYGVDLSAIAWLQAGVNQPGRAEKVALTLPGGIRYRARSDTSLSAMLESGEIDAAITARAPDAFLKGDGKVMRLFPDYRAEEERFFKKTGIFPIMHVITLRRAAFEQHPWIAMNLYKAFEEAKRRCLRRLCDFTMPGTALPWIAAIADEIVRAQGEDPYPYGIEASRTTLAAFCRYCDEQGVTARRMKPEDLFPAEVQASARV